jgi:hypothetical protein
MMTAALIDANPGGGYGLTSILRVRFGQVGAAGVRSNTRPRPSRAEFSFIAKPYRVATLGKKLRNGRVSGARRLADSADRL